MLGGLEWRNEWRLLCRNPLLWIALAAIAGFSLLIARGSPADPGSDAIAALLRLNLFAPAFMLPFLAGALGPLFYLREVDNGMAEMFGCYPLTLRQWLRLRAGNLTLLLVAACLLAQLVFVAVLTVEHPGLWPDMLGHSLLWLAVLHAPSCLLWASVLAWLACRKAHAGFLYLAAGLGWLAYLAVASVTGTPLIAGSVVISPQLKQAMLLLDPYAATAMINPMPEHGLLQWRELNVALGRLIWLGVCLLLLRNIRDVPAHAERGVDWAETGSARSTAAPTTGRILPAWLSHVGIHLRYLVRDRIFPLQVLGWIALLLPEAYGGMDSAEPLSRIVPDSRDALNRVVWDILPAAGALLLLYTADRICRLYPATRMHELYAASPHRPAALVAVQLVSLWVVAVLFIVLAGMSVLLAQLFAASSVQPLEYLVQLGLTLSRLALFGVLFVAVHGLVRARFLANLAGLLIFVLGFSSMTTALWLEHPLWRPLSTPLAMPDHFWGFGGGLAGHFRYMLFWVPLCGAALLLAVAVHHRTMPFIQVSSIAILRRPITALAAIFLSAAAWQGVAIDRSLSHEGALATADERARLRAGYERGYSHWSRIVQPEVVAVRSQVDFYPSENRVRLRADMRLVNRSDRPIAKVLVGRNQLGGGGKAWIERASVLRHDAALGQTVFQLNRLLQPGEGLSLRFDIHLAQSGLDWAAMPLVLRREFSSLPAHAILPIIGFKRELTLRDASTRRQLGLSELKLLPPSRLPAPAAGLLVRDKAMLDAVVSTDAKHYAVAQGSLVRRWQAASRTYFHYRSEAPLRNLPVFFSVPWQPQSWNAGVLNVETHSPEPLLANDPNVLAMRDTLSWLNQEVTPYPGTTLRLLAVPDAGPSGYALPQIIQISHRLGFRAKPEPGARFSQVYRRAAHETAHQWFGHLLGHGIIEERAFLIESLAKYAELVMIERRYGKGAMRALVDFERDRYRQARLDPTRPIAPLIDADESEDMYSRATLVFACLREKTDDDLILAALRQIAAESERSGAPARSKDFIDALMGVTETELKETITSLFLGTKPLYAALQEVDCNAGGSR